MSYTPINKSTDYFNTKLYTGNGSTQSITGVGFQPDFTWLKSRSASTDHQLFDAVRGTGKSLISNNTDVEYSGSNLLTAFGTDGFSLGDHAPLNGNGVTFASWNWKANGAGSTNYDGSINTTVSVNTTSGFSIVKWTGNSTAGETIGHGLGVTPKVVIIKRLSGSVQSWICKFPTATDGYLALNTTDAVSASSGWLPVSSSLITLANNWSAYNNNGNDFIAYCFADVQGFSKMGSYIGGGNNFPFIYTGFKPGFVLIKNYVSSGWDWSLSDIPRDNEGSINNIGKRLGPNVSGAEISNNSYANIQKLSNGFTFNTNNTEINGQAENYIYMAFARAPLVGSNNVPANAR